MSPRKRTAMIRYNPKLMKALRAEMTKCPNPIYGQMVKEGEMREGDMVDFALTLAHSYFSGALLESCEATQRSNLKLQMRWAVLVTAAFFDATATFTDDGAATITPLKDADADTRLAAVQALVDTGMGVKQAMEAFSSGPPKHDHMAETIHTQLPEVVH